MFFIWNCQAPRQCHTHQKKKQQHATKGPEKKRSTSRMKAVSNYVLALRQCSKTKQLQNLLKQTTVKKISTKWMGTSQITTESLAAESSILCATWYWEQRFINEHVRKKYSKSQRKAGKYLLNKKAAHWTPWTQYQIMFLLWVRQSSCKTSQNKPTWRTTSTKWMGASQITTESIAAESCILCANWYWEQWLINKHIRKKYSKSQPKAGKYLLNKKAAQWTPWKRYQNMYLL